MQEQEFQAKLGQLINQLSDLPEGERNRLEQMADETQQRHVKMRKTIGDLQESLDYLRLSVKYLVFDLEATRRENRFLRKLVENHGSDDERAEGAD